MVILQIFKRFAYIVPVAVLTSFLVFSMLLMLPGDPTFALLGERATESERNLVRERLGLDQPIPIQYARWVERTLTGDLGRSLRTQEPVVEMLATAVPVTLELTLLAVLLSIVIGVPAGILAALRRNTWFDFVVSFIAMAGMALPYFWAGILLIRLFSLQLGWLPPSGYVPFLESPIDNLRLMILPALTVGISLIALIMRQTRTSMLEVMSQDYIRTARAKGMPRRHVLWRHALRNAMIPVLTIMGLQFSFLLAGTIIIENVFYLPGLGRLVFQAITQRDLIVVEGVVILLVASVVLVNLIVDILYAVVDPRLRVKA